jgi:hypothetical protein
MNKRFPILGLAVGGTLFIAGVIYLFLLRFESGDVYPPYSSLRADPLGTMAWCESLERLPGLRVRRDMSEDSKLPEEKATTYLHLAAEVYDWRWLPPEMFNEIESFANQGGRLVITMLAVAERSYWNFPPPVPTTATNTVATNAPVAKGSKRTKKKSVGPIIDMAGRVSIEKRWGVEFDLDKLVQGDETYKPVEVINETTLPLPPSLEWHSGLVLTNLDRSWRKIYSRGKNAVVAERRFGRGSVVIATDSYFVSNEAMWKDRQPELLAWMIGPSDKVVFDEAHLGVTETSGVAVLMHRYGLTGVIVALVMLAMLFIWKNATSLVPPYADVASSGYISGKEVTAGFVNLLRRNIPVRNVLEVCFEEWTKSLLQRRNFRIAGVDEAQMVMEAERGKPPAIRNPVRAYREICQALKRPQFRVPGSEFQVPSFETPISATKVRVSSSEKPKEAQ